MKIPQMHYRETEHCLEQDAFYPVIPVLGDQLFTTSRSYVFLMSPFLAHILLLLQGLFGWNQDSYPVESHTFEIILHQIHEPTKKLWISKHLGFCGHGLGLSVENHFGGKGLSHKYMLLFFFNKQHLVCKSTLGYDLIWEQGQQHLTILKNKRALQQQKIVF